MQREKEEWHLKKEVSYSHIVSTLLLAGMLIGGWYEMQKRIHVLEGHINLPAHHVSEQRLDDLDSQMSRINAINGAMQVRLEDLHKEILRRMDRQDVKLDRIEDRINENRVNGNGH